MIEVPRLKIRFQDRNPSSDWEYKKVTQSRYRPKSGPEDSRNLRFPDFMTTAKDGGGKVVSLTHRPSLTPGNTPGTYFC